MAADSNTLAVAERFVSVNGEGLRAGQLSAFIRFAGCELACSYCDTAWARPASAAEEHLSVEELVQWAFDQPTVCITLTGGEPMEQARFLNLVEALLAREEREPRVIEVETNGAHAIDELVALRERYVWNRLAITLDCKMPSSGMAHRMVRENMGLVGSDDAVKFVCGAACDLDLAQSIIDELDLTLRTNVMISPVEGEMKPAAIVDYMKRHAMTQVRLQLQLHKLIWPGAERGV